ncbi:hypothetical protein MVEG_12409 [Podila verticillata NRRL 6337]|uniref:Uncharacterized protein n=1 Tax=Podila verticillata NRRL 6337 TaxID=1069443 RepID=A0A086TIH2_9FUNG|nr:hypothetical protein MVEG_12409 [Podila verticillata NRRL 6337]
MINSRNSAGLMALVIYDMVIPVKYVESIMILPRAGGDWDTSVLEYFRVEFVDVDSFEDFFGIPPPILEEPVLTFCNMQINPMDIDASVALTTDMQLKRTLRSLHRAVRDETHPESAVDDFGADVLKLCMYDEVKSIGTNPLLKLKMCGEFVFAKPDVYVYTSSGDIIFLIQEDKRYMTSGDYDLENTEAQMVAEAIAAFQQNNRKRALTRDVRDSQLLPCITMLGSYPIFYLFEVTTTLANHVRDGTTANDVTSIRRYRVPPLLHVGDTMYNNIKRREIMEAYMAFKRFV